MSLKGLTTKEWLELRQQVANATTVDELKKPLIEILDQLHKPRE